MNQITCTVLQLKKNVNNAWSIAQVSLEFSNQNYVIFEDTRKAQSAKMAFSTVHLCKPNISETQILNSSVNSSPYL